MAEVISVNISLRKGQQKHPVDTIELKLRHGIVGDAHAGNWHRQISLLAREDVREMEGLLKREISPGEFAENILTEGLVLYKLPVGTKLRIGTALCQVTQIGKECHQGCEIQKQTGKCVMPTRGIFAKVVESGAAQAGDVISVVS